MPRNGVGTYSLPAGNPVVTATVISSVWANTTLSDLATAMTDSLSRSGQGAMTAPLQLASGAIGAPGLTWSAETTSGWYRAGAGDFRVSIAATDKFQITTNGIRGPDGAVGTPAFSFLSDTDNGLYRIGADSYGFSVGGTLRLTFDTTAFTATLPWRGQDGTAGAPALSFSGDPDTGINRPGTNRLDVSTAGASHLAINDNAGTPAIDVQKGVFRVPDGVAGTPALSFGNDPNTGIYRVGGDYMGFVAGASFAFAVRLVGATSQIMAADGTAAVPIYSFDADIDTGFYRDTANQIGIALGGTTAGQIAQGTATLTATGLTTAPTCTLTWRRVGNLVVAKIGSIGGTSNANTFTLTGLPAAVQPNGLGGQFIPMNAAVDNGVAVTGTVQIQSASGTITLGVGVAGAGAGWTAAGAKSIADIAVHWLVA